MSKKALAKYTVRKLNIDKIEQIDALALASGELYSMVVSRFWRTVRKKGIWLSPASMMRWCNSNKLHAHSADAVVQCFFASLRSWSVLKKTNTDAKPPHKRHRYFKVQWKSSAIRVKDGFLMLSNGKGNDPLVISWSWGMPKLVEIGWNGIGYVLRATYLNDPKPIITEGNIVGIDLGEIHIAVAHNGTDCIILNGRKLRSIKQYQNKLKAKISSKIDKKKRGSKRRKRLMRSKNKQLNRIKNQINDIPHKQTTKLISVLESKGAKTVVIGDVRDIRQNIDYGKKVNQKLHQWSHGQTRSQITYKAERKGITVVLVNEAYTSQTCPCCGHKHKPQGRNYKCNACGFQYHRDGVGAINIRNKYLGNVIPVVGVMSSPIGIRYKPHNLCSSGIR
jgi:putative transposase